MRKEEETTDEEFIGYISRRRADAAIQKGPMPSTSMDFVQASIGHYAVIKASTSERWRKKRREMAAGSDCVEV